MDMRRGIKLLLAVLVLLLALCAPAMAKVVSAGADFYYLDNANVLSEALEGEIYFSNVLLNDACGAQVVVVTLNSTGSESIDDYAYELFNSWGIGDASRKNGFLLLLAIGDDDYYALCGAGLDSKFSSGTMKTYFDRYLEDDFAAGNYESGVKKFFEAAYERIADTYNASVTTQQGIQAYQNYLNQQSQSTTSGQSGYGGWAQPQQTHGGNGLGKNLLIIILIVAVLMFLKKRRANKPSGGHTGYQTGYTAPKPSGGSGFMKWYMLSQLFKQFGNQRPQNHHSTGFYHSTPSHTSHSNSGSSLFNGLFGGGSGSGGSHRPSGGFGGARGGGGSSRGGGAGRGRR